MEEKQIANENVNADAILTKIVLATMTRFNDMTENEYLIALGVDVEKFPNLTEERVNNIALCNMLLSMQRKLLKIDTDLKALCGSIDAKEKITQYKKRNKSNKRRENNGK